MPGDTGQPDVWINKTGVILWWGYFSDTALSKWLGNSYCSAASNTLGRLWMVRCFFMESLVLPHLFDWLAIGLEMSEIILKDHKI